MDIQQSEVKPQKKYFYEISFIRAIACMCIVMVHVTAGFYHENDQTFSWLTQFFNQISRYGTPAFAIISGFLLYNQVVKRGFKFNYFFKSRINKVIIPFLVWSVIYLLLKWSYNKFEFPNFTSADEVKDFIYFFFTGKSNYHLYFIAIVVQFYLLFPVLQFFKSKKNLILFTLVAFFINYFFVTNTINIGHGFFNKFINERVFFFHWAYYFFLGGLLVYYWERIMVWVKNNTIFSITLGIVVIISGIFEYLFAEGIESNRPMNMISLPLLFIAFASVYTALTFWPKTRDFIVNIGNYSMGIYLVHPFILFFLRNHDLFKVFYDRTRYLPLVYLITFFTSILVVKVILKLPFGNYIVTVVKSNKKKTINKSQEISA
ncbi:surface polysaccharide O-acyltransferase-like enzyme [Virgibacillus halotolerans]|uniref:acyltransferase n=1 Tax=Virgibacillus halotolerans TaxID=1071053 RepID=UPI00196194AC|nr:acyltransferase [Virgibacillus halotolerans]MBM7600171.1 surface polysaccharide O-acyltransferase-like enzyme [Virgibacillus halotolerans]